MLLIDGVKYELWTPSNEDEFEQEVKKHTQDIFSEESIYLDKKQKLKSLSGIGSIPDGYVIVFGDSPEWHIVEVELSSHPLYEHIVSQVSRFINGISNPNIQRGIVNVIDGEISRDDFLRLRLKKAIEPTEIHRFLTELVSKQPILTIIIEKDTEELREALNTLRYPQIKVVEFQTFTREGIGLLVHAHLFEPVYQGPLKSKSPTEITEVSSRNQLYQQFFGELIEKYCRRYPSRSMLKALPQSWLGFGAGKAGFWFNWSFRFNRRFSVELIIQTEDSVKNKQYFDRIKGSEAQLGIAGVSWERLDDKKSSRVAVYTNGDIQEVMSDKLVKERLIEWAIETMKNFSDNFGAIIKELK